jgi:hypothetical protein
MALKLRSTFSLGLNFFAIIEYEILLIFSWIVLARLFLKSD